MTTKKTISDECYEPMPQLPIVDATSVKNDGASGSKAEAAGAASCAPCGGGHDDTGRPAVARGLTDVASSTHLRSAIRTRALRLADRFRVIRTVDVALACFPERDYKASLTAAQRAMRGLVKAGLLRRYRTDRFQTVYGLTQPGAQWLQDADISASASVRRVSDMTNPEHRLWSQFLVLAAEARGLQAWTEQELMQLLNQGIKDSQVVVQGPLRVNLTSPQGMVTKFLRPDALIAESDGATWIEVDRSARGSDRATDLRALVLAVGADLATAGRLRRVVVFVRTSRIEGRVRAVMAQLVEQTREGALVRGRRQVREVSQSLYEVWATSDRRHQDGRVSLVDKRVGHVVVQQLPIWLPKLRLDGRGTNSTAGWLGENFLPYRRPTSMTPWARPVSPLLGKPPSGPMPLK